MAHHNLGLFYYDNNNKKLAVKNFEMSITYNPKSLDSYECLANLYEVEVCHQHDHLVLRTMAVVVNGQGINYVALFNNIILGE